MNTTFGRIGRRLGRQAPIMLGIGALLMAPASASAGDEENKFKPFPERIGADRALGGWLEGHFATMVGKCAPAWNRKLEKKQLGPDKEEFVSLVPTDLVNDLGLRAPTPADPNDRITKVYDLGDQTLNSLFANVIVGGAIEEISGDIQPNLNNVLDLSDIPLHLKLIMPQFNGSRLNRTCANALSFASSVEGGYALPAVTVKAALSAGLSGNSINNLRVTSGTFYSPFVTMWTGAYRRFTYGSGFSDPIPVEANTSEALRIYSGLLFWRWYSTNKTRIGKDNEILEYFSGIAVFADTTANESRELAAGGEVGVQLPFGSASARFQGNGSSSSDFYSTNYSIAAYRDGRLRQPGSHYVNLPTPNEIETELGKLSLTAEPQFQKEVMLSNTDKITFTQSVYGIVGPRCMLGEWMLLGQGGAAVPAGLRLEMVKPSSDPTDPGCQFTFSFKPVAADLAATRSLDFRVGYTTKLTVGEQTVQLSIAGEQVTFLPPRKIKIQPIKFEPVKAIDPSNVDTLPGSPGFAPTSLLWRFEFQLDAPANSVTQGGAVDIDLGDLTCDGGLTPITIMNATSEIKPTANLGYVLTVNLRAGVPPGEPVKAHDPALPKCSATPTVKYNVRIGGVEREVTDKINRMPAFYYPMSLVTP